MRNSVRIGTSGWNYSHWKGPFYSDDYPKSKWLEYYAQHFNTVEVNATFYQLPKPVTFENWRNRTPESFLWSVKANRYITHIKRLRDAEESLKRLYDSAKLLEFKLGPILFQLPPDFHYDETIVKGFLHLLDPSLRHIFEVRNDSWINNVFFQQLKDHNVAFCIADTAGRYPYSEDVTANFVYIRLHGSQKLYASKYSEEELQNWACKIKGWSRDTYVYFDNDFAGYAIANALRLKEILGC
ncbi:MAG: DUF72 domain-containing protein [Thermodesulfobacteriota bacterium]|nr:DUF72 domain-containing protein [Thermodesulfobacteriota bacterium]